MFSTLKRGVALGGAGLALSVGGVALPASAAPAQTVSPSYSSHPVSVSGAALCGTRYLRSGVTRYQPAQLVRYSTREEVRLAPVQFGHYSVTLVPRQGEKALATVYCGDRTRFSRFVFIDRFDRFQTDNLVSVTRIVGGRP
jgi:hypothetical protein